MTPMQRLHIVHAAYGARPMPDGLESFVTVTPATLEAERALVCRSHRMACGYWRRIAVNRVKFRHDDVRGWSAHLTGAVY